MFNQLFSKSNGFNYSQYLKNVDDPMNCIIQPIKGVGGLYLGNIEAAANVDELKRQGINAVVTVAARANIRYSRRDIQFHYKIQAEDMPHQDLAKYFQQVNDFIEEHRTHSNVLVHCFAGVSRSATCVIAYLMFSFQWSYQKAFNFVFHRREIINPNPGFVRQLCDYEAQLNENYELSSSPIKQKAPKILQRNTSSQYDPDARSNSVIGSLNNTQYTVPRSNSSKAINYSSTVYGNNYYGTTGSGTFGSGGYTPLTDSRYKARDQTYLYPSSSYVPQSKNNISTPSRGYHNSNLSTTLPSSGYGANNPFYYSSSSSQSQIGANLGSYPSSSYIPRYQY